ncbi:MAG: hypothetical protein JNJ54_15305 [Myxococcaceae bacterium]|nr:hypothetical protein [Myxococcaceae bacterium]
MTDTRFDELVKLSEGEVTARRAEALRAELATSPTLRAEQARLEALVAALEAPAPRLEGLDLRDGFWAMADAAPAPVRSGPGLRVAAALAVAAGLALVTATAVMLRDDGVREKGASGAELTGFEAWVLRDGQVTRLGPTMHRDDALGFSYRNLPGSSARAIMVYAEDAAGRVFWFYPAWTDPGARPSAVPIGVSNAPVRLDEAVRHELSPGLLTIHALFLDTPVSVVDVEAGRVRAPRAASVTVEVLP